MSQGRKVYQSLFTFDGRQIASLEAIPDPGECDMLLVSEKPIVEVKKEDEDDEGSPLPKSEGKTKSKRKNRQASKGASETPPKMIGLRNNVYDFKSDQELLEHKINKVEESIFNTKKQWHRSNH